MASPLQAISYVGRLILIVKILSSVGNIDAVSLSLQATIGIGNKLKDKNKRSPIFFREQMANIWALNPFENFLKVERTGNRIILSVSRTLPKNNRCFWR